MVMEKFDDVDSYLAARSDDQQATLAQVRALIQKAAPDAQETMSYGMPGYRLAGKPLVYFGAFAKHWSLFPEDVERLGPGLLARLDHQRAGKGTLQFPYRDVPFDLVKAIVEERVRQNRALS